MARLRHLKPVVRRHFRWETWEALIAERGITIDRPRGTAHPDYPTIVYPMDYGYVPETVASDDEEVDVFRGETAGVGLVGLILSHDLREGDREVNLLYDCSPREIYLAHGFINFDRTLLRGVLVLRRPMRELWEEVDR